jgi:hypothetical protein
VEPNRPFRWDLARGDQLGSLLDGIETPDVWYVDELLLCAAKVLARSGDGELCFVGRSVDSLYDLLSGCLSTTSWSARTHPLPLSIRYLDEPLGDRQVRQLRANLAADGLAPHDLARRHGPVVFVDLVFQGITFGHLYAFLRRWIADERAQWDVIRLKLRFIGITQRRQTSPNTWRWQQNVTWTRELPAAAVVNVSLDPEVWRYLGDMQTKVTESFRPDRWLDESVTRPRHNDKAREALAEAVALFRHGQSIREELVVLLAQEPRFSEPWLRALALELRRQR